VRAADELAPFSCSAVLLTPSAAVGLGYARASVHVRQFGGHGGVLIGVSGLSGGVWRATAVGGRRPNSSAGFCLQCAGLADKVSDRGLGIEKAGSKAGNQARRANRSAA
jgi:hypothetical protein